MNGRQLVLFIFAALQTAAIAQEPQLRDWTSTTGTKINAKLVGFTQFDVTLENSAGKRLIVSRKKISDEDNLYLQDKSSLKSNEPSRYAPTVRVAASMKSMSQTTKQATISLDNASGEDLSELYVYWTWASMPYNPNIEIKRNENLQFFSREQIKIDMKNLESATLLSRDIHTKYRDPGVNRFEDGLIIQVYYQDALIANYTTKGTLKQLAQDPSLRARLKNAPTAESPKQSGLRGATLQ